MAKKTLCVGFVAFFTFFIIHSDVFAWERHEQEYRNEFYIESGSVLVMNADTGQVLYETGGYQGRYPASVTKVMTALLVLENVYDLDEMVVFSFNAVNLPYYAATFRMEAGESLSVRNALYGLMLTSGNDLARGLAEHVSGSVESFVEKMNNRAWELGAVNTRFVNPCGLPGAGQFVTAFDIAVIMREAVRHPVFLEIISTDYMYMPPTGFAPGGRNIRNTHRMVRLGEPEFDGRVVGGKTGFTNAAQHTLVTYAVYDDFRLIVSVLFSPNRTTFTETGHLLDFGFELLHERRLEEERREQERQEAVRLELDRLERERLIAIERAFLGPPLEIVNADIDPANKYKERRQRYISDAEAAVVASSSLGVVLVCLGFIKLIYGKKSRHSR